MFGSRLKSSIAPALVGAQTPDRATSTRGGRSRNIGVKDDSPTARLSANSENERLGIKLISLLLAALLMVSFVLSARAQGLPCAPRALILDELSERHGEVVVFQGVSGGSVFEVFWSPVEPNSWTAAVTRPDMLMCLIAVGNGCVLIPRAVRLKDETEALRPRKVSKNG